MTEPQGETDEPTVTAGGFNTGLRKGQIQEAEIRKDTIKLTTTIHQRDIMRIYRPLHPTTARYTCLSSSHGALTKTDHVLGHKHTSTNLKE